MEKSQMKNIVVLKNLPSNLVEEAIVIMKSKKAAREIEYIDKKERTKKEEKNKDIYIVREAESVLTSYINVLEKKDKKNDSFKLKKKYKHLKLYSIIVTIILISVIVL